MNVSGIRPYSGFYQYNSIKLNELRNQKIAEAQPTDNLAATNAEEALAKSKNLEKEMADAAAKQTFDSYDFAQQFKPDEPFEMKGIDSDVNRLDMEKAVSDLDKDQVLKQYQYFVGPNTNAMQQATEQQAVLRSGENFTL